MGDCAMDEVAMDSTMAVEVDETEIGWMPNAGAVDEAWNDREVIDQVLLLVAEEHRARGAAIGHDEALPSLVALRRSPLGRDLRLVADAERGRAAAEDVRAAVRRIEGGLLRSSVAEVEVIPAWFRGTALGRLLARAERAVLGVSGLVAPDEAAGRLGVPIADVEGWLDEGALSGIAAANGGVLVPVEAVERRRAVARELRGEAGDVVIAERWLAS